MLYFPFSMTVLKNSNAEEYFLNEYIMVCQHVLFTLQLISHNATKRLQLDHDAS